MAIHLVVVSPFGEHQRGARITDPVEVAATLEGDHAHCVVRVEASTPDAPVSADHQE